jgi:hypothetical protein
MYETAFAVAKNAFQAFGFLYFSDRCLFAALWDMQRNAFHHSLQKDRTANQPDSR